ncbi:MAG: PQQ-binding-like beta-propeller repeat protein [Thermoguttaceae bacterium]|nr:PQQ-binding-like beta-propeller repeat protein [Thermoguttaceae bacterium]
MNRTHILAAFLHQTRNSAVWGLWGVLFCLGVGELTDPRLTSPGNDGSGVILQDLIGKDPAWFPVSVYAEELPAAGVPAGNGNAEKKPAEPAAEKSGQVNAEPNDVPAAEDAEENTEDGDDGTRTASDLVFPKPPRELRRAMADAQNFSEMGRYAEAVRKIDQILGNREDYFFLIDETSEADASEQADGGTVLEMNEMADGTADEAAFDQLFGSLKQEAEHLLAEFPREGRELYEMEFGVTARLMLEDGVTQGRPELISEAAQRYFFTQAGSEAAFLMGLYLLDQHQAASARSLFQKLHRIPQIRKRFEPGLSLCLAASCFALERQEEGLAVLREAEKESEIRWADVELGGKPLAEVLGGSVGHPGQQDALARLLQKEFGLAGTETVGSLLRSWQLLVRNQARSVDLGEVSMPILTPIWESFLVDSPEGRILAALQNEKRLRPFSSVPQWPTHSPLVVGDSVLMRTAWNLSCVDLQTGKKLWAVPGADYREVREQLQALEASEVAISSGDRSDPIRQLMSGLLQHQIWGEGIYGDLASDGECVFCIEDTIYRYVPIPNSVLLQRMEPANASAGENAEPDPGTVPNRLACYDIRTGKLLWHLGGNPERWSLEEGGTMFLGVPLCVNETLYVLGQKNGMVRLLALDPKTGGVRWSQELCLASSVPQTEPTVCTPRFCSGVLVCPTPNHVLIGVDPSARKVLWGNIYEEPRSADEMAFFESRRGFLIQAQPQRTPGSEIVSVGGKVLYWGNGGKLVCLDVLTGRKVWMQTVGMSTGYIAFADEEKCILVQENGLKSLSMKDGNPSRNFTELPGPVVGRGFLADGKLHLPLKDGTIVRFSLAEWKIDGSSRLLETGTLGNLVPAGDFVLSQSAFAASAYLQKKGVGGFLARIREKDPHSPEAIHVEAAQLWEQGKRMEAVELLKTGGVFTRERLKICVLEAIGVPAEIVGENAVEEAAETEPDGGLTDETVQEWFALMETAEEQNLFCRRMIRRMESEKRWSEMLRWVRAALKTGNGMKVSFVGNVLETVEDAAAAETETVSRGQNVSVSFKGAGEGSAEGIRYFEVPIAASREFLEKTLKTETDTKTIPQEERSSVRSREEKRLAVKQNFEIEQIFRKFGTVKLFQTPDVWLGETLSGMLRSMPAEEPASAEIAEWAESEYSRLTAELQKLENMKTSGKSAESGGTVLRMLSEDPNDSSDPSRESQNDASANADIWSAGSVSSGRELQKKFAVFAIRFPFRAEKKDFRDSFVRLLKITRDTAAMESLVFQTESTTQEAAQCLVSIFMEMGESIRAALYVRWLEKHFPDEKLFDGKTAAEWRLALDAEHPVRKFLDLERTEFPAGKITVRAEKFQDDFRNGGTDGLAHGEELFSLLVENGPNQTPFAGMQFRAARNFRSLVLCEDPLGRILAKSELEPFSFAGGAGNIWLMDAHLRPEFSGTSLGLTEGGTLSVFQIPLRLNGTEKAFVPALRTFLPTPIERKLDLEPFLLPLAAEIREELSDLHMNALKVQKTRFSPFVHLLQTADEMLFAAAPESGLPLWYCDTAKRSFFLTPLENERFQADCGQMECRKEEFFLQCFAKLWKPASMEISIDRETVSSLNETGPIADSAERLAENGDGTASQTGGTVSGKNSPGVSDDFVPFVRLEDISSAELADLLIRKGVKEETALRAESRRTVPVFDPRTGKMVFLRSFPDFGRCFRLGNGVFLIGDAALGFGKFVLAEQKFEWFLMPSDALLASENVPFYFNDQFGMEVPGCVCFVNARDQIDIWDLETGQCVTVSFPEIDETTLVGASGKKVHWNADGAILPVVLPDADGNFTVALTHAEDWIDPALLAGSSSAGGDGETLKDAPEADGSKSEDETDAEEAETDAVNADSEDVVLAEDQGNCLPPDSDERTFALNHALLCRFDAQGKPLWEKSVFVERSFLVGHLPSKLPILCLAHQAHRQGENLRSTQEFLALRLLDRRCGRFIYDAQLPLQSISRVWGDPLAKRAEILLTDQRLVLEFSEEAYGTESIALNDQRAYLAAQVKRREDELSKSRRFQKGLEEQIRQEKIEFERRTDSTADEKAFFAKRVESIEQNIEQYRAYILKEEKEIQKLKDQLDAEIRRLGPLESEDDGVNAGKTAPETEKTVSKMEYPSGQTEGADTKMGEESVE